MDLQDVKVYGKRECILCDKAKEKLTLLKIPYSFHLIEDIMEGQEDWRNDGSIDVLAAYSEHNTLPILCVGDNYLNYPDAMKKIKENI